MKRLVPLAAVASVLLVSACRDTPRTLGPVDPDLSVAEAARQDARIVLLDRSLAPDGHDENRARAGEIARDLGVAPDHTYGTAVFGFSGAVPDGRLPALERDPRVVRVEDVEAWPLAVVQASGQELPTGVDRIEVDLNSTVTTDGSGTAVDHDVAIIDTGISDHEDLNIGGRVSFAGGDGTDGNGHGTHVAGTVAALDDGAGVVGVAPGARVHAVKVCRNGGFCFTSDIVAGIDWVAARKADGSIDFAAANMSISTSDEGFTCEEGDPGAVHRAICGAVSEGVVFALAAGNDGTEKLAYPEAFAVSAIADFDGVGGGAGAATCRDDEDDTRADFSNWGETVDVAAPGVCILSTWNDGGYNTISGTSMAAPHAAGAVALYLHANGDPPATDADGVATIESSILGAAIAQGDECGFTNDDGGQSSEPLLFANAEEFAGSGECAVAGEEEATGTLAGTVTDAGTTDPVEGATVSVDGTSLSATTDQNGDYTITDVPEGTHDVTASADGYASETKSASVTGDQTTTVDFALQPETTDGDGTVTVDGVTYSTRGGRMQDRHLDVTVALVDGDGNPVADASVAATLERDADGDGVNDESWSFSGTTGTDGTVTFTLNNHGTGCYVTTVDDVRAEGLAWDGVTPENGYCNP